MTSGHITDGFPANMRSNAENLPDGSSISILTQQNHQKEGKNRDPMLVTQTLGDCSQNGPRPFGARLGSPPLIISHAWCLVYRIFHLLGLPNLFFFSFYQRNKFFSPPSIHVSTFELCRRETTSVLEPQQGLLLRNIAPWTRGSNFDAIFPPIRLRI